MRKSGIDHKTLFDEALGILPGGVNSPVRSFSQTGTVPLFARKGSGKFLFTEDGRRLTDFCLSWGAIILGHAHPLVVRNARAAVGRGSTFGVPTRLETELATAIRNHLPSMERMRFVSSGTEAVMSALRLARGYTNRGLVLKFDGCYHGHSDLMLVKAGSGTAGLIDSGSSGVAPELVRNTVSIPWNDTASVERIFNERPGEIACVICEPVPCNMGVVPPSPGFLEFLRDITARHGSLLVFDEVITGFRVGLEGVQGLSGVRPDLTTLGKIIGGGFPAAAFGGRREIMDLLAPDGPVYQAGTLSGNPVAMTAGLTVIRYLETHPGIYATMNGLVARFHGRMSGVKGIRIQSFGTVFSLFFREEAVTDFAAARNQDLEKFRKTYKALMTNGIFYPPSFLEACFLSIWHDKKDMDTFASAIG